MESQESCLFRARFVGACGRTPLPRILPACGLARAPRITGILPVPSASHRHRAKPPRAQRFCSLRFFMVYYQTRYERPVTGSQASCLYACETHALPGSQASCLFRARFVGACGRTPLPRILPACVRDARSFTGHNSKSFAKSG
jgi:hypothetical protein